MEKTREKKDEEERSVCVVENRSKSHDFKGPQLLWKHNITIPFGKKTFQKFPKSSSQYREKKRPARVLKKGKRCRMSDSMDQMYPGI